MAESAFTHSSSTLHTPEVSHGANDQEKEQQQQLTAVVEAPGSIPGFENVDAHPNHHEKSTWSIFHHHSPRADASASFADPGPPPDGGLRAWLQVLAGHFVNALTWGYVTSYGIFQTHYVEELGYSPSSISWVGSIQIFLLLAIGTVSGRAADAGMARLTVFIGSVFLIFGTFMTSLCTSYWQIFLAQGLCVGIGMGIVYMPALTLIGTYFSRNRALAVGVAAAGSGTGSLIFPAMIQYLIPEIGQSTQYRTIGARIS